MKVAKSLPIICQLAIVLFVFLPEIVLLEIKYNQISGGFLQAYRFETLAEILAYLLSAFVIFAPGTTTPSTKPQRDASLRSWAMASRTRPA